MVVIGYPTEGFLVIVIAYPVEGVISYPHKWFPSGCIFYPEESNQLVIILGTDELGIDQLVPPLFLYGALENV